MREEKYSEIIHDALNFLDDEMIEEVDCLRGGVSVENVSAQAKEENEQIKVITQKKPTSWRKWAALVASICLLLVAGNAWEIQHEGVFHTGNPSGKNEANDSMLEGDVMDTDQSGLVGMVPDSEDDKYGVQDDVEINLGDPEDIGNPQFSENKPDEEFVNLQNYTAVYFSKVKSEKPSDDAMTMLSKEECEILDKFLDSLQRGTKSVVEASSWTDAIKEADGYLYFELEDGKTFRLVLLGDGSVCNYETPNVWIQMDKRVYRILIESLKENS